jgi:beta-glucosidase
MTEVVNDGRDLSTVQHITVPLTVGTPTRLELRYRAELLDKRTPRAGVGMLPPNPELLAAAVESARSSDAAVVVVNDLRTEGSDVPSLALPGDQDHLIAAVAAANPRTVVILHTAGPVLMPWLDHVPAVLAAWYPGQENGDALADILFGAVNPSGRLPVTFPAADDQHPAAHDPRRYPGLAGVVRYEEELQVGYRWWQSTGAVPLFPFGHGISYTRFDYDNLAIAVEAEEIVVRWSVRNVGSRPGREIAQLYLG